MVALDLDFTVVPTSEASAAAGQPGDEENPVGGGATSCSDLKRDAEIVCTEDIKGILHPKMKILSFFTYSHVVPNP